MKSIDSPMDSFRIRLVCTVLDSLGKYFHKGERRLIMDRFLFFFERYIFSKNYVLMDLEFMILDMFDNLRPKFVRFQSGAEAVEACRLIEEYEAAGKDIASIIGSYQNSDDLLDDYYYEEEYGEEDEADAEKTNDEEVDEAAEIDDINEDEVKDQIKE